MPGHSNPTRRDIAAAVRVALAKEHYTVLNKDGTSVAEGMEPVPVGSGVSGVVYRAKYKGNMERAVKVLVPDPAMHAESGHDASQRWPRPALPPEIDLLATVTHQHIAKITDYGTLRVRTAAVPYFAMDFISERTILQAATDPLCTASVFIELLGQILDAIVYLHSPHEFLDDRVIFHNDIKANNILVRQDTGRFAAVLCDLGNAHVLSPVLRDGEDDSDGVWFDTTPSICHERWRDHRQRWVPRHLLRSMFPDQDLYAFGKLVQRVLQELRIHQSELVPGLGRARIGVLDAICKRLQNLEYHSAEEVRRHWAKLEPTYVAPLAIPELSLEANIRITTPSGHVSVTPRLRNLINHPTVQRLRNLPELDFTYLVKPGATHTRMLHAFTNVGLARQYIEHLLNDEQCRLDVDQPDATATLLWALLHDVGHYPLSRMFEDIVMTATAHRPEIPRDDELFWAFVAPDATSRPPLGTTHHPERWDQVPRYAALAREAAGAPSGQPPFHDLLCSEFGEDVLRSLEYVRSSPETRFRLLNGVVDSAIGVNRVAYLLDDSTMTGVRYGLAPDVARLLESLTHPPEPDDDRSLGPILAITEKGLSAAEAIVLARYWMMESIYLHHDSRAIMAKFKFVIAALLASGELEFDTYFKECLYKTHVEATRYLAERFDIAALRGRLPLRDRGLPVTNPLAGLLDGNRAIYKRVCSIAAEGEDTVLYEALTKRAGEVLNLTDLVTHVVERALRKPLRAGDVLLDIPVRPGGDYMPGTVYVQRSHGSQWRKLYGSHDHDTASIVLSKLKDTFDLRVKKCRVFVHPAVYAQLDDHSGEIDRTERAITAELWDILNLS